MQQKTSKERYFEIMIETWKIVREYMQKKVSEIEENDPEVGSILKNNYVVKKRLFDNNPKMRPLLLRLSFEACRGGNWKNTICVSAAVELLNISTYVINAIFDEKGEDIQKKDINEYIIVGMLLRELATKCLNELQISLSPQEVHELNEKISEINLLIYIGQHMDLYQLKKGRVEGFDSTERMKELYIKRAELLCGYFMKNVAYIGSLLANATSEQKKALDNYGLIFGTALQILNDMGDFVTNENAMDYEKTYQDQFSDIRHGKLTFPVIRGLEINGRNIIKRVLEKKKVTNKELEHLTEYLKTKGIVNDVREITKKDYRRCKKELVKLPESESRDMLSLMASILRSNKYYSFFRELKVK